MDADLVVDYAYLDALAGRVGDSRSIVAERWFDLYPDLSGCGSAAVAQESADLDQSEQSETSQVLQDLEVLRTTLVKARDTMKATDTGLAQQASQ